MTVIPIPDKAIGRVGMVAALKRVGEADIGKLVFLRQPAGLVTSLVGSDKPIFAWLALALGEPIVCHGKASRDIYVADRCLIPLSEMSEAEIETVSRAMADADFNAALGDLRKILKAHDYSAEELEGFVDKAGTQFAIHRALEVVAVPVALKEIGFWPTSNAGETFLWVGLHNGVELHVDAGMAWLDRWVLLGTANSRRQATCIERILPAEAPRGLIVKTVLAIWRTAFGKEVVPDALQLGEIYDRHIAAMRQMNPGLPTLSLDPPVFRTTIKWLRSRHDDLFDGDRNLSLSFSDGLLRLRIGDTTYGCPAYGHWADEYQVRFADFLKLPPEVTRSSRIQLERTAEYVLVNGYPIASAMPMED